MNHAWHQAWTLAMLAASACGDSNVARSAGRISFPDDPSLHELDSVQLERVAVFGFARDPVHGVVMDPDAIEPLPRGGAAILDRQRSEVWWFEREPAWRARIHARGRDPGALESPSDLALIGDSLLLVMDPGNARIARFERRERGLVAAGEIPHAFGGSVCALGSRVFVNALIDGHAIHELGPTGERLRSFGAPPDAPGSELFGEYQSYVSARLLTGPFLCTAEPDLVISVAAGLPTIDAFSADGGVAWRTVLDDFNPVVYRTTQGRALRATFDPETGSHLALSAMRWTRNAMLVQYALVDADLAATDLDRQPIDSRLLDLRTGREISRSRAWPVLRGRSDEFAYRRIRSGAERMLEVSWLRRFGSHGARAR